jgi:hypothetical protein
MEDTAEPLVPELSPFEDEIATGKKKRYKSPDTDQILAELVQTGGSTLHSESTNLLILFGIRIATVVEIFHCCTYL